MKVLIHDNVKTPHQPRTNYLADQVKELLGHLAEDVHQIELTLSGEGHNGAAVTRCHVSASLGSLGVLAADERAANEHDAVKGAVSRLMRGISRRIDKRHDRRKQVEVAVETDVEDATV